MKSLKPGLRRCLCAACNEGFNGLSAFERHRVGSHKLDTRRCMSVGEMYEAGMRENSDGYWILESWGRAAV